MQKSADEDPLCICIVRSGTMVSRLRIIVTTTIVLIRSRKHIGLSWCAQSACATQYIFSFLGSNIAAPTLVWDYHAKSKCKVNVSSLCYLKAVDTFRQFLTISLVNENISLRRNDTYNTLNNIQILGLEQKQIVYKVPLIRILKSNLLSSRKHAYKVLTPSDPTFI